MGFSFNTNLDAMTALFNLNQTTNALSTSVQRLSSGLRINSPADDPAGYVISNVLQAQVDGQNQALTNVQEAANQVKSASGAVTQINTLLTTIRQAALDALNTPSNAVTDQTTIQSALQSINSLAANTQYGTRSLLNGSAGISAAVTNGTDVGGISFGGTFAGGVTQSGNVTVTVTQAATEASLTGASTYTSVNSTIATVNGGTTGAGGTVNINGQSFSISGSATVQTLINDINNEAPTTGVAAAFSGNHIVLTQQNYGANFQINFSETANIINNQAIASVAGVNASVTVSAPTQINGVTSTGVVQFSGGRGATDSGLKVTDTNGNSILLTPTGNSVGVVNATVATLTSNPVQYQIGANAGQTASFSFNNVSASALGTTAVAGQSLASIDVTTPTGASNALSIVDAASSQLNTYAAQLGAFQSDVLLTTQNYLANSVANLSASVSSITDVNVAQETANLANLQLLQQAGVEALYTANNQGSYYLKLLQ